MPAGGGSSKAERGLRADRAPPPVGHVVAVPRAAADNRTMLSTMLLAVAAAPQEPAAAPGRSLDEMDRAILSWIDEGFVPGAVLLHERIGGEAPDARAFGRAGRFDGAPDMEARTVFDLASLTKVVATATSVMVLVDEGRVELDEPVATYLPGFGRNGKGSITVEELLLHRGGLIPDNALADYEDGSEEAWRRICDLPTREEPGSAFTYTDVGFIALGELVERVDGRPLDRFAAEEIFVPLGMADTCFNPPASLRARCAPTERRGGVWMRGEVHDPRAHLLGGVAGHAGLFSTASDLGQWCRMILGGGAAEVDGKAVRVLSESAVQEMTRTRWLPGGVDGRALGFDVDTAYSSPRGSGFPRAASFGHTGFTGTCFWLDPAARAYYVLLTNRVHPDGQGKVTGLRRRIGTLVGAHHGLREVALRSAVTLGVDRYTADDLGGKGARVAVITNATGRDARGRRTIDVLASDPDVDLVRIFSPEHGLFSKLEGDVGDATDEATGLPVHSLYGDTREPTDEMLEGLDAVVFDIQDIGVRYYTYISTLGLAMGACGRRGVRVVVLDRPNPITGGRVEGPACDPERLSFIAWRPMPVTHGMTVGEIARMFRGEWGGIECDLTVVPMEGWSRAMWWEDTGVRWIDPSPNMRNPTQAVLYPCVGLLEGANLSVGRGTDEPFERFGAPFIDGPALAAALSAADLPGLRFSAIEFTPDASRFAGERCEGVHITVTDRDALRPVEAGLAIVWLLNRLHGADLELGRLDARLMSQRTWARLLAAPDWRGIAESWSTDVAQFLARRERYLIYR